MLKRKNSIEEGPATRKKVRKDDVSQLIARLEPKILTKIFYELIMRGPARATIGKFGVEPWNFAEYRRSVINCSARAALLGVCKKWSDLIIGNVNFWKQIHIDGNRIPSPPKCYKKGWSGYHFEQYKEPTPEDENDLEVVQIVGEVPRSALSVQRSQNTPIDFVLVDPTYDPEPRFCQYGRPLLPRPGLLALLHERMDAGMIGSLSITTIDIQFVKELLDPGLELDERVMGDEEIDWISDAEKISLACDGKDGDHFDLYTLPPPTAGDFRGIRTRKQRRDEQVEAIEHARLRKKFRVWPELHTLRINTRRDSWMGDNHRCVLSAARFPALLHLELRLWVDHPIWLWTIPYAQLTHLKLATETPDGVLLGIVARCVSLESLTITLRDWYGMQKKPQSPPTDQVVLSHLKKLSVQIEHTPVYRHRIGRDFLNFIDTPKLESLEVVTENVDRASCFIHLLKRSKCQLRELRLNFYSSYISSVLPDMEPVYYVEADASDDESDSSSSSSSSSCPDPYGSDSDDADSDDAERGDKDSGDESAGDEDSGDESAGDEDSDVADSDDTKSSKREEETINSDSDATSKSRSEPTKVQQDAEAKPPPIRELMDKFNLPELLNFVAPTLKTLAIQSGPMNASWLEDFNAPLLEEITVVCFGIRNYDTRYPSPRTDGFLGPAHDFALHLLRWMEAWLQGASAEEKELREVNLVAAPLDGVTGNGFKCFYGKCDYGQCVRVNRPPAVKELIVKIRNLGGKVSVWWNSDRRRSERERLAWLKSQPPQDKPASRAPRIIKGY